MPKDTIVGHYIQFFSDTLAIMDPFPDMKGFYIVMDNAPMHSRPSVDQVVIEVGYIYIHIYVLPPTLFP